MFRFGKQLLICAGRYIHDLKTAFYTGLGLNVYQATSMAVAEKIAPAAESSEDLIAH